MARTFLEFVADKSQKNTIISKITLGDGNDFRPFVISDDPNSETFGQNSGLAPIVRAFKKGGNWGWSRDDKKGEDKPVKIGGKKLFLTGGALRDHLVGKRPNNIELVTNASPDETYHVLKQQGFKYTGDKDNPALDMTFWLIEKDQRNRPFKFGVRVKHDEYELGVFRKGVIGEYNPGTQEDDAAGRDFTINAMYLLLTNNDGPNRELIDFYGGLRHLRDGQISSTGDLIQQLSEDPIRIIRYARMLSRYGNPKGVSPKEREQIKNCTANLGKCDRKKLVDEFMKSLRYDDEDIRKHMLIYGHLGILDQIFPGLQLDLHLPKELREIGDKHMPIAWLVHKHAPEEINQAMQGFEPDIVDKVQFLVHALGMNESLQQDDLVQMRTAFHTSGVSSRRLREWGAIGNANQQLLEAFIEYSNMPLRENDDV